MAPLSNYAFKPTAEQALRSIQSAARRRLNAALCPMNMLPTHEIPDLSSLIPLTERLIITRGLAAGGASDEVAYTLQLNSVRILDGAIADYERGRSHLKAFQGRDLSEFALDRIAHSVTAFESCLWNLERFTKHARALRSHKDAEPELKALIPANLSILAQVAESRLTKLRHTLAHLEGATRKGKLPSGHTIALMPTVDGLMLGSTLVTWSELIGWLIAAHKCMTLVASYRPGKLGIGA